MILTRYRLNLLRRGFKPVSRFAHLIVFTLDLLYFCGQIGLFILKIRMTPQDRQPIKNAYDQYQQDYDNRENRVDFIFRILFHGCNYIKKLNKKH